MDLNARQIAAANQYTATVTIHQIANPTTLDAVITVPTVGPDYYNGPRGVVFYPSNEDRCEETVIICTYAADLHVELSETSHD